MAGTSVERYTLQRRFFKIFGASFRIIDAGGATAAFCRQKALRLREHLTVYTSEACTQALIVISTPDVIDFSAAYDVTLPTGERIGRFQRKGLRSLLRDTWTVCDGDGNEIGAIEEDSGGLAFLRRMNDGLAALLPQRFEMRSRDARPIASFRTHFNPVLYRLGVTVHAEDEAMDDLMIIAAACLLGAIEQRQG